MYDVYRSFSSYRYQIDEFLGSLFDMYFCFFNSNLIVFGKIQECSIYTVLLECCTSLYITYPVLSIPHESLFL